MSAASNAAKKAAKMTFEEAWDASSEHVAADTLKGIAGGLVLNAGANMVSESEGGYMGAAVLGGGVGGVSRAGLKYLGLDTQVSKLFNSAGDKLKTSGFSDAVDTKLKGAAPPEYRTMSERGRMVTDPQKYRAKQGDVLSEAERQMKAGDVSMASDLQREARAYGNSAEKHERVNYLQNNSLKKDRYMYEGMSEKDAERKIHQDLFNGSKEDKDLFKKYNRKEYDTWNRASHPTFAPAEGGAGNNIPYNPGVSKVVGTATRPPRPNYLPSSQIGATQDMFRSHKPLDLNIASGGRSRFNRVQ